jgi:hypothetical protein
MREPELLDHVLDPRRPLRRGHMLGQAEARGEQ